MKSHAMPRKDNLQPPFSCQNVTSFAMGAKEGKRGNSGMIRA